MIIELLSQHSEEAAFLAGLRSYVGAPHYDQAHIYGLQIASLKELNLLLEQLISHAQGGVFTVAALGWLNGTRYPHLTGHHLIEVHCFSVTGNRGTSLPGFGRFNQHDAPCVCASQSRPDGTRGILHAVQGQMEAAHNDGPMPKSWPGPVPRASPMGSVGLRRQKWTYKKHPGGRTLAHKIAFPHCNDQCISNQQSAISNQLDDYHKGCGIDDNTPLRSNPGSDKRSSDALANATKRP